MASKGRRKQKASHKSQKTTGKWGKCSKCGKPFKFRSQLQKHMKCHKENKALRCNYCNKISKNEAQFIKHRCKEFICHFCGSIFKWKLCLEFHIRRHNEEDKPFKCNTCSMKFKLKIDCEKHQAIHKINKILKCMMCECTFTVKSQLNKHYASHFPGDYHAKSFDCNICGATFEYKLDLTKHYSTHSGKGKSFVCNVCQATFECELKLREHYDVHGKNVSLIGCNICDLKFNKKCDLKEHYNKAHSKTVPNNCIICDLLFESKESYLQHFTEIHCGNIVFTCDICNITFTTKRSLKKHIRCHKNGCDIIKFKKKDITSHFDYNRRCQNDLEKFLIELTDFKRKEKTSDKPGTKKRFICDECTLAFRCKKELAGHLQVQHTESHRRHSDVSTRQKSSYRSTSLSFDKSNYGTTNLVNCAEVEQNYESFEKRTIECRECGVSFKCKIEFWEHIMHHLKNNESALSKEHLSVTPSTSKISQTKNKPSKQEMDKRDTMLLPMNEVEYSSLMPSIEMEFETYNSLLSVCSSVGSFEDTFQSTISEAFHPSLLPGSSSESEKEQQRTTEVTTTLGKLFECDSLLRELFECDSLPLSEADVFPRACQVNTETIQGSTLFCPYCPAQFHKHNILLEHLKTCLCREDIQLTNL